MKAIAVFIAACALSATALAKLPAPSPEAAAKAAEAKAKADHTAKVGAYQLCKSQNKVAAYYRSTHKTAGKPVETAPCADPGPFVYKPATAAAPAAPAAAEKKAKKS